MGFSSKWGTLNVMGKPFDQAVVVDAREHAFRRVRLLTLNAGAFALGVAGIIAAFVASKTHAVASAHKTEVARATRTTAGVPPVPAPTATVSSGAAGPAASASPPSAPVASSAAPVASSAAPVAVSGGS